MTICDLPHSSDSKNNNLRRGHPLRLGDGVPKMGNKSLPSYVQELQEFANEQSQTIALLAQQLADKKEIIRRLTT